MSPAPTARPAAIYISMQAVSVNNVEEANQHPGRYVSGTVPMEEAASPGCPFKEQQTRASTPNWLETVEPVLRVVRAVELPSPKEELRTLPPAYLEGRTHMQHATHDSDLDAPSHDADDSVEVKPRRAKSHKRVRNAPIAKKPKLFTMRLKVIVPEPLDPKQIPDDGWTWRKYGTKPLKSSPHPRNYFRCNWHDPDDCCLAKKRVEISQHDKNVFLVTYLGRHTHNPPQKPTRVPLVTQAGGPPVDIGPRDNPDTAPRNNPESHASTDSDAKGKMHSVQSTLAASQSAQVGVETTKKLESHDDETDFVFDLEVLVQRGQYPQDYTAECSALGNVEECSFTPRADVFADMPLYKSMDTTDLGK
eukprot:SM000183S03966  [mRNA]  locus=s183:807:2445:- [translate_table: standard]